MTSQPNVILVITDDQGYGDLGCFDNPIIQTPHINNLYKESVRLTNFHVGPTCAPTRAGLLTGHYCNCTGVWHTIMGRSLLRKNEVTMADVFKANGYKTGLFGKWHLGDNYPFRPHDRGFEYALCHGGGGVMQAPDYWGNDYFDDTYYENGKPKSFKGYCTDVWFDEALKYIETNKDAPFFCYLSPNAPHHPYNVADSYSDPYQGKTSDERAHFYGMITNIDDNMAKLRSKLKELDIEDNTILIWMTDNGTSGGCSCATGQYVKEGYNYGMRGKKGSEYEGGHRVPIFFHWPHGGLTEGKDVDNLTANIDIFPTLIDMCGLKKEETHTFHGTSIKPLMFGQNENWPDRTIVTDSQRIEYPKKWRKSATMTDKWRLINGKELYDLKNDPEQRIDVADVHPDVLSELRGEYENWWDIVSPTFDEETPIIIGSEHEKLTRLCSHDWHETTGAWNQNQIREGNLANGYWIIDIAKSGKYEFELCRWPKEENRTITEGIGEFSDVGSNSYTKKYTSYSGGTSVKVKKATIWVGKKKQSGSINSNMKGVKFIFNLQEGVTQLKTTLSTFRKKLGSYYVYARRIENE